MQHATPLLSARRRARQWTRAPRQHHVALPVKQIEDDRSLFAPIFAIVGGFAALVMANHERLRLRVDAL